MVTCKAHDLVTGSSNLSTALIPYKINKGKKWIIAQW